MDPQNAAGQSLRGPGVPSANQNKPPSGSSASHQQPPHKPTASKKAEAQKPPPAPGANPRRQSAAAPTILPPDRATQALQENSRRPSHMVQMPSALTLPEKSRRMSSAKQAKMSLSLTGSSYAGGTASSMGGSTFGGAERPNGKVPGGKRPVTATMVFKKPDSGEVSAFSTHLKTIREFVKSDENSNAFFGSMSSRYSTISSIDSLPSAMTAEVMAALRNGEMPNGGGAGPSRNASGLESWSLRWCINQNGRAPGMIRCARDVCVLRNGFIAVAEAKNARVQVFQNTHSGSGWRSVACLGDASENDHTAQSFRNPTRVGASLIYRKMEPAGLCETMAEDNVLAVTDLNRLLYVDATGHGGLQAEVIVRGRKELHGVAVTQSGRLIMCEIGMQPSVALYENTGSVIREFRGEFKRPAYVAWSEDYQIAAVSDSDQRSILLYDINGRLINRFGNQPQRAGAEANANLDYPSGICWLPEGRLLVADRAGHRVAMFDLKNMTVETVLKEADGLRHPVGLGTNGRNRIVLSEEYYDFGVAKFELKMFKFSSGSATAMSQQDVY